MLDAASIMSRDVVTARPEDTVARVAQVLAQHRISAVPICDPSGGLLGMASEGDLMRLYLSSNIQRRAWWLALLADGTDLAPDWSNTFGRPSPGRRPDDQTSHHRQRNHPDHRSG